jgi:hypothetical protein
MEFGIALGVVSIVLAVLIFVYQWWSGNRFVTEMRLRDDLNKRAFETGATKFVRQGGKPVGLIHERTVTDHITFDSSASATN